MPKDPNEQDRIVKNLIRNGTIVAHKSSEGKLLARVDIHGRVTDWLPVKGVSNRYVKIYIPITKGEQVEVHSEFGNADSGVIHRSIFSDELPEPQGADEHTAIVEFHDGGGFRYDTSSGKMEFIAVAEIRLAAPHIDMDCETLHIAGDTDNDGSLNVDGDITTSGEITDAMGDLTNFTTTDGASRA